ncbi:hypothetical protein OSJ57_17425 [Sphingomonas sp. HH69]
MLDRVEFCLFASFKPHTAVVPSGLLKASTAGNEEIIMGETKACMAAIGDGTELSLIEEACFLHLGRRGGGQVKTEVAIFGPSQPPKPSGAALPISSAQPCQNSLL